MINDWRAVAVFIFLLIAIIIQFSRAAGSVSFAAQDDWVMGAIATSVAAIIFFFLGFSK